MIAEFAASIQDGRAPSTDGEAGLRVLSVLEAAATSLRARGALVDVAQEAPALEIVR
jgi:predicted dehydrogenase